jgi:hypothetical protein
LFVLLVAVVVVVVFVVGWFLFVFLLYRLALFYLYSTI